MPWYIFLYFWSLWHQPVYQPYYVQPVQQAEYWQPYQKVPVTPPVQYVTQPPCQYISPTVSVCP